jgi:hypothetical protein
MKGVIAMSRYRSPATIFALEETFDRCAIISVDVLSAYYKGRLPYKQVADILAPPGTLPGDEGYDGSKTFVLPSWKYLLKQ